MLQGKYPNLQKKKGNSPNFWREERAHRRGEQRGSMRNRRALHPAAPHQLQALRRHTCFKSRCPPIISERNRHLQRAIQVSGGSKCPLALSSSIVPEISPDEFGP